MDAHLPFAYFGSYLDLDADVSPRSPYLCNPEQLITSASSVLQMNSHETWRACQQSGSTKFLKQYIQLLLAPLLLFSLGLKVGTDLQIYDPFIIVYIIASV